MCTKANSPLGVKLVSGLNLIIVWSISLRLRRYPGHRMMMVMAKV
jgi:hypothetical protein